VVQKVDPISGLPVAPATPLVRSKGAEVGVRSDAIDDVRSTLGLSVTELDSELLIDGDTGVPVPTVSATRRLGLDWSNSARVGSWLLLDGDLSSTYARFVDDVPAEGGGTGRYIPGAIPVVLTLGGTTFLSDAIYATVRLRFFSRRPLDETDSVESTPSAEVNARIGYHRGGFEAHLDLLNLLNLLNRKDDDQSYYYQSQLRAEAAPVEESTSIPWSRSRSGRKSPTRSDAHRRPAPAAARARRGPASPGWLMGTGPRAAQPSSGCADRRYHGGMSTLVRLTFSLEKPLARHLERLVDANHYENRSEYIRDLVRNQLVAEEWEDGQEALATITLVYDHHKPKLNDKLIDLQHDHHEIILAATHVHLDRDLCAEMIMMRGRAQVIRTLADQLRQQKGVLHASLSMSSTGKKLS
jgi:CopG family nickel-responsive transcriptional regulator